MSRVRNADPELQQRAAQAVDAIKRTTQPGSAERFFALGAAAEEFQVPLDYVLDELERRVDAETR